MKKKKKTPLRSLSFYQDELRRFRKKEESLRDKELLLLNKIERLETSDSQGYILNEYFCFI
jgi:hypothetical protein